MHPRQDTSRPVNGDAGRKTPISLLLPASLFALVLVLLSLTFSSHAALAETTSPHVDVLTFNTTIDTASSQFVTNAINTAEHDGAQALVMQINTPGGDLQSMENMKVAELNSTVPIISYISPKGAWAASAGAFITLAAQVAAMAPGTTIGASSPVTSTGGDIGATEKAKIESVLESDITSIQTEYGRQVGPALLMITNAASYTDQQALDQGIIDLRASSLSDLLNQVNNRTVTLATGNVTLHTAGVALLTIGESPVDNLYSLLLDPNVVFLLFVLAMIGIFVEISHPGAILPGVIGAISLILFLFAAGSIAPNWAGLALMGLAFLLLVLDVRLTTHGVLTAGAVISLIVGALLFFNSGGPYSGPQVNPILVYVMGGFVGLLGFYIVTIVVRMKNKPVTTGIEGMIGATAIATTPLIPDGRVSYGGEDWYAVLADPTSSVDPGAVVRIVSIEGLRLRVVPTINRVVDAIPTPDGLSE
jgi:membrane-bound serine protease (ClpP class)